VATRTRSGTAAPQSDDGRRIGPARRVHAEQLHTPEAAAARHTDRNAVRRDVLAHVRLRFATAGGTGSQTPAEPRVLEIDEIDKAQLSKEAGRAGRTTVPTPLLWPLKDLGGKWSGFGARRLDDDDPIQAKYLKHQREHRSSRSQRCLFGVRLPSVRSPATPGRGGRGYTDVMAMHAAVVPTAVASCGTAFGDDHMSVACAA